MCVRRSISDSIAMLSEMNTKKAFHRQRENGLEQIGLRFLFVQCLLLRHQQLLK